MKQMGLIYKFDERRVTYRLRWHRSWNIAVEILTWRSIGTPRKRASASMLAELPRPSSSKTKVDVRSNDFSTYLFLFMKPSFVYNPILAPPV